MTDRRRPRPSSSAPTPRVGRRTPSPSPLPVALTGTPGVGKSSVGRRLGRRWKVVEVSTLARRLGAARRRRGALEVDLARLFGALGAPEAFGGVDVVVGHLAHLLPVREAIVLRCEPGELLRRLRRSRRGGPAARRANFVSEAVDLVLTEAVRTGVPVYEVDTTGRTVPAVAREVARRLRGGGPPRMGVVDWLARPSVTAHLLDGPA